MFSHGLLPTITQPTRITEVTATLIDNIFTNINPSNCKTAIVFADISDHLPIILEARFVSGSNNKQRTHNPCNVSPME